MAEFSEEAVERAIDTAHEAVGIDWSEDEWNDTCNDIATSILSRLTRDDLVEALLRCHGVSERPPTKTTSVEVGVQRDEWGWWHVSPAGTTRVLVVRAVDA